MHHPALQEVPEVRPLSPGVWRKAIRRAELSPAAKLVCFTLSVYLDSGKAWPGMDTLMADTGLTSRTITAHLKNAEEAGLLKHHPLRGCRINTHYVPYTPALPEAA
jgi:hypothetical protein